MAQIKKNALANIVFPVVDGTDFASIESGLTASNFESKVTKKYFGVNHGGSAAFTSGTISKAATLVRSGIFQQTLKATETNFDYVLYSFIPNNTSLAHQVLVFQPVDYDDSDLMSRLSDIGSDLLSYLTGMSGMLSNVYSLVSDVDSQVLLNASMISDVDSQLLLNASMISDAYSYLVALSGLISDVDSQVNLIPVAVSASDMSDIASRAAVMVWGAKYTANSAASSFGSLMSDVYSRLALTQSNVSDVLSALDSQFVWTSAFLSDMNSDLASKIGGITASVGASDISDIASAVWANTIGARVDSRILVIQSLVSDVDSQLLLNASMISDIESQLDLVPVAISASDMSDIVSRVWAAKYTAHSAASSFGSLFSDVFSRVALIQSNVSDVESALDSQFVWTSAFLSDMNSDLASKVGAITASVGASDISDIASAVWANTIGARVDSRVLLVLSNVSDVQSALDSQFVYLSAAISDMHSDLYSAIGNVSVALTASDISDIASAVAAAVTTITPSDISDIASAVWAAKYTVHSAASSFGSLFSDVYSRLALTQSNVSDVLSALDSQFVWTSAFLSDMNSDLSSQIGGITAGVSDSNISDIASAVWANTIGARVDSRVLVIQSMVSDVDSALTSQYNATSNTLSTIYELVSDVDSQLNLVPTSISASDMSDIVSRVWSAKYTAHSAASSFGSLFSDVYSRLALTQSNVSDIQSALDSQFAATSNTLSTIYELVSDVDSQLLLNASMISDIDSQLTENYSLLSDIDSQLTVTHSLLSDVESQLDAIWTTALTEAYSADGAAPTPAQALFLIMQMLTEFSINGTTLTVKKLDGSTAAATFTLDDATSPTSLTRAT